MSSVLVDVLEIVIFDIILAGLGFTVFAPEFFEFSFVVGSVDAFLEDVVKIFGWFKWLHMDFILGILLFALIALFAAFCLLNVRKYCLMGELRRQKVIEMFGKGFSFDCVIFFLYYQN